LGKLKPKLVLKEKTRDQKKGHLDTMHLIQLVAKGLVLGGFYFLVKTIGFSLGSII
jgi:hypothetical protein